MELKNIIKDRKKNVNTDQSRRNFLMVFSVFIGSVIGVAISFPLIGFLFHPLRKKTVFGTSEFLKIGNINDLKVNIPKKAIISSSKIDGWNRYDDIVIGAVWLIKQGDGNIAAMSTVCPHLGCGVDWNPEKKQFLCPCHSSVFDIKGKVVSGPSPRSMDTLDVKTENDEIFVKYRKLKLGTSEKVET